MFLRYKFIFQKLFLWTCCYNFLIPTNHTRFLWGSSSAHVDPLYLKYTMIYHKLFLLYTILGLSTTVLFELSFTQQILNVELKCFYQNLYLIQNYRLSYFYMYNTFVLVFYFRWVEYEKNNNNLLYTLIVRN